MNNHILYRQYDQSEKLLYIGISASFLERLYQHKCDSTWFDEVHKITLERFKDNEELLKAEKKAIQKEHPLFNVQHSQKPPSTLKPTLTLTKVAKRLSVSRRKLYNMIGDGRFPVKPIKGTKPRLWNGEYVDVWLADR